jgi:2-dehydro-3-deoxyphosphogluconate aldolase / (4S)-4-hydroxy-2-oxoglutarate aldolase
VSELGSDRVAALRRSAIADRIRSHRLIAILRRVEPRERLLAVVGELADDGVRVFEVTFDGATAAEDLVAVRERVRRDGIDGVVGAGTIVSAERLDAAVAAGAQFLVAPTLDPAIVARALDRGMPVVPGAYSPTEIALAWACGATFVKVFPVSSLGPSHIKELRGPLPEIELIATGGVDATNALAYLDAGCVAVGVGGALGKTDREGRQAIIAAAS